MKIQVQQRGGFAGVTQMLVDVDSANVAPAQAAQLERLAKMFESAASDKAQGASGAGADFLTYDITVQDGPSRRTVTLVDDDSAGMAQVRSLLEQLSALAQGPH
jgi:hypothetical protein